MLWETVDFDILAAIWKSRIYILSGFSDANHANCKYKLQSQLKIIVPLFYNHKKEKIICTLL